MIARTVFPISCTYCLTTTITTTPIPIPFQPASYGQLRPPDNIRDWASMHTHTPSISHNNLQYDSFSAPFGGIPHRAGQVE